MHQKQPQSRRVLIAWKVKPTTPSQSNKTTAARSCVLPCFICCLPSKTMSPYRFDTLQTLSVSRDKAPRVSALDRTWILSYTIVHSTTPRRCMCNIHSRTQARYAHGMQTSAAYLSILVIGATMISQRRSTSARRKSQPTALPVLVAALDPNVRLLCAFVLVENRCSWALAA